MTLPTSSTWNLADFSGPSFAYLLASESSDMTAVPGVAPYFQYTEDLKIVEAASSNGVEASLTFHVSIPTRFTMDVVLRCPRLPHNLGDLNARRFGFTMCDDHGRGFSLYFAKTGVAISRVDNFNSTTALPDTQDVTEAVSATFFTVRVAVDGGLGRAYIFVGEGVTDTPALRWVVPIDQTPAQTPDLFRLFAKGTAAEPVLVEIEQLRLANDLVIANYPPIADAGPDRVSSVGSAVRFDGRGSYDVEGVPLKYLWTCIDAPYGSSFVKEVSSVRTFPDGDDDEQTAFITVNPADLPIWLAAGDVVRLRGLVLEVASVDTNTGSIEVTSDSVPDNITGGEVLRLVRQSVLVDRTNATPVAVPDIAGLYRFRLVVNDGEVSSEPAEVLANISPLQMPTGIEPDVSFLWQAIGDEYRLVDGKKLFEDAWIGVAQVLSGKMLEAWQHHYNTSIRDAQRGFMRKWIAYRTVDPELDPDSAELSIRHGGFVADHDFRTGVALIEGTALTIEVLQRDGTVEPIVVQFPHTQPGYNALLAAFTINNALQAASHNDIVAKAFDGRGANAHNARLLISGKASFRLSGTACEGLGLDAATWGVLAGKTGSRVTDRVYKVEGYDLADLGVQRGDLLVLNNGESFVIDRVLDGPHDPGPNQRVLLFAGTPPDTAATWAIPSVIRSTKVDYEINGAYPGDYAKTEIYQENTGKVAVTNSTVVAQKSTQLAVNLGTEVRAALLNGDEVRFVGVKHRKAIALPDAVMSIPTLQEVIAAELEPALLREHLDYVLEPFYRDVNAAPVPMLQFHDSVFIATDIEPPDLLWAEITVFDNQLYVEGLFGRLVNFLRDDAATFGRDFNYVSGVAGLLYAQQRGPNLFAMSVGAQILLGQPFAESAGYIEEIRANYSPRQGRVLVRDADGNVPTQSDTVRAYYYKKDPNNLSATSGLATNQDTGIPWAAGDYIPQFSAIGAGITFEDIYEAPQWWRPFNGAGALREIQKFHTFACTFNLDIVDLANISLLASLLTRIKPTASRPLLVGAHDSFEDIDIKDNPEIAISIAPNDTLVGQPGYQYDDYRGDGDTTSRYDDGVTRFDALVDGIVDTIRLECKWVWPGGALQLPSSTLPISTTTPIIDVDGAKTGTPGQTFLPTNGMNLPAGNYQRNDDIKTGPILPPLS